MPTLLALAKRMNVSPPFAVPKADQQIKENSRERHKHDTSYLSEYFLDLKKIEVALHRLMIKSQKNFDETVKKNPKKPN